MTAQTASLSVLDRLLDEHPDRLHDRPASAAEAVRHMRRAVHRDVEALLNARRPWRSVPAALGALRTSPLTYGLPDFTAGAYNDRRQKEVLRSEIEQALHRFEPRLAEVKVQLLDDNMPLRATLMVRIEAVLMMDPAPEPITFDTTIDTTTAGITLHPLQQA